MRLLLLVVALTACKGKSAEVHKGSCNLAAAMCDDYESTRPEYIKSREDICKELKGSWSRHGPCLREGLLGSCRETTATFTLTRHYYLGRTVDVTRTKVECGAYGTWLEPSQQQ